MVFFKTLCNDFQTPALFCEDWFVKNDIQINIYKQINNFD